jgi:hypothetical protein
VSDEEDILEMAELIRSTFAGREGYEAAASDEAAVRIVTVEEFAAVDEPGTGALVGTADEALLAVNGDAMLYGDGGTGKTTLAIDLGFHLAAGDDWLEMPVPAPVRVLLVEREGPRPMMRRKLNRKLAGWHGSPLEGHLYVWEAPWATFTFADEDHRQELAAKIAELEVDVVIVGPLNRIDMNEAGTLQEVRDFTLLIGETRRLAGRPVAFVLVHHENKVGRVSGAWEGAGDTLLHVMAQGHGRTRLYVQKARWASSYHATTLQLRWADGEGFELADAPVDDGRPAKNWDAIAEYVLAHGGTSWNKVERAVAGTADYLRQRRDWMLEDGVLVNAGVGKTFELWHRDDPACPPRLEPLDGQVRRAADAPADAPASTTGGESPGVGASVRRPLRNDAPSDAPTPPRPPTDADAPEERQEGEDPPAA